VFPEITFINRNAKITGMVTKKRAHVVTARSSKTAAKVVSKPLKKSSQDIKIHQATAQKSASLQAQKQQKFKKYVVDAPKIQTPEQPKNHAHHSHKVRHGFLRSIYWGAAYVSIFFIIINVLPALFPVKNQVLGIIPIIYLLPLSLFAFVPQLGFSGWPLIISALFVNTIAIIVSVFYYLHRK
jgi:lipopolysaccharide export LptBFGC system permease protein LptF